MTDRDSELDLETLLCLRAARETGALEALMTSAATPQELASEVGITDRAARLVVDVLEAEGFLERVGGVYEPTNRSLGFLAKRDVRSIGTVPARLDTLERGIALPETMRTGSPPASSSSERRNRLGARAATDEATVRAIVTALLRFHPAADRVVDVGGAPGRYAREIAARGYEVTLVDRSDRLEDSRALLSRDDLPVAIQARATDTNRSHDVDTNKSHDVDANRFESLPNADLAVAVDLTYRLAPSENRRLIETAGETLEPNGWLVFVDRIRGDGATTAAAEALLETGSGEAYEAEQYRSWFDAAGFTDVTLESVPGTDRQAIGARHPGGI